jgi:hypothetical protein
MFDSKGRQRLTYIHRITTSRLFTGVSFSKSPEECIGQSIFAEVGKDLVVNFEGGEVGYGRPLDHL